MLSIGTSLKIRTSVIVNILSFSGQKVNSIADGTQIFLAFRNWPDIYTLIFRLLMEIKTPNMAKNCQMWYTSTSHKHLGITGCLSVAMATYIDQSHTYPQNLNFP